MAKKVATRSSVKTDPSVFKRLGKGNQDIIARNHQRLYQEKNISIVKPATVCIYWLSGRCTRNPCRFLHQHQAKLDITKSKNTWKNGNTFKSENSPPIQKTQRKNCDHNKIVPQTQQNVSMSEVNVAQRKSIPKIENCTKGVKSVLNVAQSKIIEKTENCTIGKQSEKLQSWFCGNGLSVLAQLDGNTKAVTGIVCPPGSNKLFCGSKDKSLRVWDCNSGQCGGVVNFNDECGTLVYEGPWIFAGLRDEIKAWNLESRIEVIIRGSGGLVNAITMFEDILFAGMEDGTILSWKSTSKTSFSETATSLKGHSGSVLSLIIGAKMLFSGSGDHSIRVWDVDTLKCMHVLSGHTGEVTSVICWDKYLFSGSLDKTIKVWGATESGNIEEVYKHDVADGVLAFCGMHDAEKKPFLLCSCKDNGVCLYDLPLFVERGRIYSKEDIHAIQIGPDGLIFTGDVKGLVSVWKPNGEHVSKSC